MTLQQLKYAVKVAECNSMSEAAKELFVAQPTLSNAIKDLEQEIGITIFVRNNKGIIVSNEGKRFLGYARQVVQQIALLETEYLDNKPVKQRFEVSTQHYSFAVNAFVDLIKEYGVNEYDFTIRETKTYEIIEDVKNLRSEIGILYLSESNEKVIMKILNENNLVFEELFIAKPHIFVGATNPLASKTVVSLEELEDYPCVCIEQGDNNSFYFSEELLSTLKYNKKINVGDRATLSNLIVGLNGFTIGTGIISKELNGYNIVAVPLDVEDNIRVGCIMYKNVILSRLGESYLEALRRMVK